MTDMTLAQMAAKIRSHADFVGSLGGSGELMDSVELSDIADAIDAHLAKPAQPVEAVPAAWRYVTPVGEWISRGLDEADFRIASEKGYEIQSRYEPAKPIEGVEDIRKAVEQAVTDHCNGSDLWLSTYLAAQCIAAALAHPTGEQAGEVLERRDSAFYLRWALGRIEEVGLTEFSINDQITYRDAATALTAQPRPVGLPDEKSP